MKILGVVMVALFLVGCIPATPYTETAENNSMRHVAHENPVAEEDGLPPVGAMLPRL